MVLILRSCQTKNPVPNIQHRIPAGILAFFLRWDASSPKSTHLIRSFLNVYLHLGGDLCLKAENLTQW
jgi:hypothetical protein